MSIASLKNFSVKTPVGNAVQLMPKLKYRFRVIFENFGVSAGELVELTKQVKSFKRPSVDFNEIVLDSYNSKVKLQGKPTWANVSCDLRDDATGKISKLIGEQVQKQFDFQEQSSASSAADYKFQITLEMLDGGNGAKVDAVLESWMLVGCYLKSVDYTDLDYGSNDAVEIKLDIAYDNAIQNKNAFGIGTDVGRTLRQLVA